MGYPDISGRMKNSAKNIKKGLTKVKVAIIIKYGFFITFCWGEDMLLELKNIFLVENERMTLRTEVDLSDDAELTRAFPDPVMADITVENHAGLVEFSAEVQCCYRFDCDRCARTSDRTFAFHFRHMLVPVLSDDSGDDYIEAPDYKLDTDALLHDDILLSLPTKLLCQEDCRGLCPKCGKNLNEGSCQCDTRETDPRLAILQQLLSEQ